MDALLIVVTLVSLAVALGMSVIAWRASKEEKQRAAARVAALSAAANLTPEAEATLATPDPGVLARPWRPAAAESDRQMSVPEATVPAVALNAGFLGAGEPARERAAPQRGLAVAAAVLAVLLGGVALTRVSWHTDEATAGSAPAPLELLSLRHEREGANLSVTGLVRNPPSGPPVEGVTAVVLLFDPQGTLVTSAVAPIDFVRLAAGEESPFVVRMQAPTSVARYRVSFRTDSGTLTHVDRRDDGSAAPPVALTRQ